MKQLIRVLLKVLFLPLVTLAYLSLLLVGYGFVFTTWLSENKYHLQIHKEVQWDLFGTLCDYYKGLFK